MDINCPKCKRKVMTWDEKCSIPLKTKCDKCKKLIAFDPATKKITAEEVPERYTSSGMKFY